MAAKARRETLLTIHVRVFLGVPFMFPKGAISLLSFSLCH